MTTVVEPVPLAVAHGGRVAGGDTRIALLGLGQVGRAVARLLAAHPETFGSRVSVCGALVRRAAGRADDLAVPLTEDPRAVFDRRPHVLVEALGGLEPARTLVLDALARGIPVVTANKSLLAAHGDEILDAAARAGVPIGYEASVLAGVPFLTTFARRPFAAALTRLAGIVNGTSNFVLTQLASGTDLPGAIREAQRRGFAEPDPSKDLAGVDAAEKLVILLRQFARISIAPGAVETAGIHALSSADLQHAREFGGAIKPVAFADWSGEPAAWVGPAFVPGSHPLASLGGVLNGICLTRTGAQPLFLSGAGAGPDVTAATILDDVMEILADAGRHRPAPRCQPALPRPPGPTAWFVRLTFSTIRPEGADLADLLGAYGVWVRRTSESDTRHGTDARRLVTYPCDAGRLQPALRAVAAATGCDTFAIRLLEDGHV